MKFVCLLFTCMPGERYHIGNRSMALRLCDVFLMLINSLVCWLCTSTLGLILFPVINVIVIVVAVSVGGRVCVHLHR